MQVGYNPDVPGTLSGGVRWPPTMVHDMHERLIGEKIAIDLPCSIESSRLLSSFAEELVGVGGGELADRKRAVGKVLGLVEALCAEVAALGGSPNGHRLQALLRVTESGVEIALHCPAAGIADRHCALEEV